MILSFGVGMRIKLFVGILFALLSFQAHSATIKGLVERVFINEDTVQFRLQGDSCKYSSGQGDTYWKFDYSSNIEIKKTWYEMLVMAAYTGNEIKVSIPSCTPGSDQYISYLYQEF